MSLLLQDVIVTVLALGAALLIVSRVFGALRPTTSSPACGNCASGAAACAKPAAEPAAPVADEAIPMVLHRRRS